MSRSTIVPTMAHVRARTRVRTRVRGARRHTRRWVKAGRRTSRRLLRVRDASAVAWRGPVNRLVPSPVFVLSPVRSGSTLLRVILNSHSRIAAPHEMHLRTIRVTLEQRYSALAVKELGLDVEKMEYLLWDRILHRELVRSGKRLIVDKTPGNADVWQRLAKAWPEARYIFLVRHPGAIIASLARARPKTPIEDHTRLITKYVRQIEAARAALPGLTVRYEDLAADPERVVRNVCRYLGVGFEPAMLDYGHAGRHGPFRGGIGDWSSKIKSGRIQPPTPPPADDELTAEVRELAATWGYLPDR